MNNWSDLGGIESYNNAFGGTPTSWYTDTRSQQAYKDWVKLVVNRYKTSPAIFAWELGNEPRCQGCDVSVLTKWATEISGYVKSLDSRHMVTMGDEGWLARSSGVGDGSVGYTGNGGIDWEENLKIKTLDYGVLHLYPDWWGYNYTWGNTWIKQHDTIGKKYGKPVILEEYGAAGTINMYVSNHSEEIPWQKTVLESGIAADQFWQIGIPKLANLGDQFSVYTNESEWKVIATDHAKAMWEKKVTNATKSHHM
jgi:mannan endo-1,4-beta-mannosidase